MKCGTPFELTDSSKVYGPGSDCRLNFGRTYNFYRIGDGEWKHAPVQNQLKTKKWLESINAGEESLYQEWCRQYKLISECETISE